MPNKLQTFLVQFLQFKKRGKDPWRSVTFSKVAGFLRAIWYHLYNFKSVKNTHEGVGYLTKITLLHRCFLRFLKCSDGAKSRKASHMKCNAGLKWVNHYDQLDLFSSIIHLNLLSWS